MYPILADINGFVFRSYWLMALLGIASGFMLLIFNLSRAGISQEKKKNIMLFAFFIFIPFYAGARLGFLFEHGFSCAPEGMFDGFSLWWGLITATVSAFFIAPLIKLNVWETADFFAPSIALGGFFAKLGCLLNGCCFGEPCSSGYFFGTFFQPYSAAGNIYPWIALHPVQLYSSLSWLFIFIIISSRLISDRNNGTKIIALAFLHSLFTLIIDFFRWHSLPAQQYEIKAVAVFIMGVSLIAFYIKQKFK